MGHNFLQSIFTHTFEQYPSQRLHGWMFLHATEWNHVSFHAIYREENWTLEIRGETEYVKLTDSVKGLSKIFACMLCSFPNIFMRLGRFPCKIENVKFTDAISVQLARKIAHRPCLCCEEPLCALCKIRWQGIRKGMRADKWCQALLKVSGTFNFKFP